MESLVSPVLLRLAGIDALQCDVGLQDLHRQLRDAEPPRWRRPGLTIVYADRRWHAVLAECSYQRGPDVTRDRVAHGRACSAAEQVAAKTVGDGQWVTSSAVAKSEPTLEVHRPDGVRLVGVPQRFGSWMRIADPPLPLGHQTLPLQQLADRARGRYVPFALVRLEPADELLGAPVAVLAAELNQALGYRRRDRAAVAQRSARPITKSSRPVGVELVQPLVAGLRRHAERCAQAPESGLVFAQRCHETKSLGHRVGQVPRHGSGTVTHVSGLTVTDVSGPDPG